MRTSLIALSLLCSSLSLAPAARAEGDHPCKEDAKKFCADTGHDRRALHECLKAHEAELSPACKAKGEQLRAHRGEAREEFKKVDEACKADREKLCADAKPGRGHMMECMDAHQGDLSAGCTAARAEAKGKLGKSHGSDAPTSK